MNTNYVKLSAVTEFLLEELVGTQYFKWDATIGKPQKSATWFEGGKKQFVLNTDKGQLTVSQGQMGQILMACFNGQTSEPVGKSFSVKTNGKSGLDLRYFIDLKKTESREEHVDMSQIPF